jgi:hypothetical protein
MRVTGSDFGAAGLGAEDGEEGFCAEIVLARKTAVARLEHLIKARGNLIAG